MYVTIAKLLVYKQTVAIATLKFRCQSSGVARAQPMPGHSPPENFEIFELPRSILGLL